MLSSVGRLLSTSRPRFLPCCCRHELEINAEEIAHGIHTPRTFQKQRAICSPRRSTPGATTANKNAEYAPFPRRKNLVSPRAQTYGRTQSYRKCWIFWIKRPANLFPWTLLVELMTPSPFHDPWRRRVRTLWCGHRSIWNGPAGVHCPP